MRGETINGRTVLDRVELPMPKFGRWLHEWRDRWLDGERVAVLVALDHSHVVVVADPNAPLPSEDELLRRERRREGRLFD